MGKHDVGGLPPRKQPVHIRLDSDMLRAFVQSRQTADTKQPQPGE